MVSKEPKSALFLDVYEDYPSVLWSTSLLYVSDSERDIYTAMLGALSMNTKVTSIGGSWKCFSDNVGFRWLEQRNSRGEILAQLVPEKATLVVQDKVSGQENWVSASGAGKSMILREGYLERTYPWDNIDLVMKLEQHVGVALKFENERAKEREACIIEMRQCQRKINEKPEEKQQISFAKKL